MRPLLLAATLAAVACSRPTPPTLSPESAAVTAVDLQAVHFDLRLTATNPNSTDLSVRNLTAKVTVGDKVDMGTVSVPKVMNLPANKSTPLEVPLAVKWTDMGSLAQLAASPQAVPYSLDGTVDIGGDVLNVAVPFHFGGTITHEQLVGAALHSLPSFSIPGLTP